DPQPTPSPAAMITAAASARVLICHLRHVTAWRSWSLRRQSQPVVGVTADLPHQLDGTTHQMQPSTNTAFTPLCAARGAPPLSRRPELPRKARYGRVGLPSPCFATPALQFALRV